MGVTGNFKEGEALCEKALRFAFELDNLYNIGYAELSYGGLFAHKGDGKNVIRHAQNAVRYGEEAQFTVMVGMALALLGRGYLFLGELDLAREYLEKSLTINREMGLDSAIPLIYISSGMIDFDAGDLRNAQGNAEKALKLAQSSNQRSSEAFSYMLLGRVLVKLGASEKNRAEKHILQGIQIANDLSLKPSYSIGYLCLGELYTNTGQKEKALEILEEAEAAFQEMGMDYWLRRTQEVLEKVEG